MIDWQSLREIREKKIHGNVDHHVEEVYVVQGQVHNVSNLSTSITKVHVWDAPANFRACQEIKLALQKVG